MTRTVLMLGANHTGADTTRIPAGYWLLHCKEDADWSLWHGNSVVVVDWTGTVSGEMMVDTPWGGALTITAYQLTDVEAQTAIMAARHLATPEAWWAYAARLAAS